MTYNIINYPELTMNYTELIKDFINSKGDQRIKNHLLMRKDYIDPYWDDYYGLFLFIDRQNENLIIGSDYSLIPHGIKYLAAFIYSQKEGVLKDRYAGFDFNLFKNQNLKNKLIIIDVMNT